MNDEKAYPKSRLFSRILLACFLWFMLMVITPSMLGSYTVLVIGDEKTLHDIQKQPQLSVVACYRGAIIVRSKERPAWKTAYQNGASLVLPAIFADALAPITCSRT